MTHAGYFEDGHALDSITSAYIRTAHYNEYCDPSPWGQSITAAIAYNETDQLE
jgi:hypothetical protein